MTQARGVLVPFQGSIRKRRLDLALALAMLGRAVKLHERAEQASTPWERWMPVSMFSLGASTRNWAREERPPSL
jgi:hypothetical protein